MCGRYRLTPYHRQKLWDRFGVEAEYYDELNWDILDQILSVRPPTLPFDAKVRSETESRGKSPSDLAEQFGNNEVRPTEIAPIIRQHDGRTIVEAMRWGFIEQWAIDRAKTGDGAPVINATCEKIATSPSFKGPFMEGQRCIVPISEFYEWPKAPGAKKGTQTTIGNESDSVIALAGLYRTCLNRERKPIRCFTVITCEPNSFMKGIHNRMPVILDDEAVAEWLSIDTPPEVLLKLLMPYKGKMKAAATATATAPTLF